MLPIPPFSLSSFRRRLLRNALLFLAYAAAIVVLTWPWLEHPSTRVLLHWDPPFHAWKLSFAARTLLSGNLLPSDGDTNVLYPQSGAFFFEALHWPQAVFAAPLLSLGLSPTLVYHITLVFFWAISGLAFRWWLRVLGLRDPFASLGGLFFVILPYRISYAMEFNMQLCFALPLFLGAIVQFFRRPGPGPALLAAFAWWFQAVSELYQAIFVLVVLPFILLPFFARDPALLRSWRRCWRPLLVAAAVCGALSLPFLLPYFRTLSDGTLVRDAAEMRTHALEPFSYLIPFSRFHLLPVPLARRDEMSVYPTLALALAAAFAWFVHRRAPRLSNRLFGGTLALALVSAVVLHFSSSPLAEPLATATIWLGVAALVFAVPCMLRRDRSLARAAGAGLGVAALAGFLLSFGPDFFDSAAKATVSNPFFSFCSPVLGGFRVISRFALFPTLALCTAAAFGLSAASAALVRRRVARPVRMGLLLVFLAAFAVECLSPQIKTRPVRDVSLSAAIAAYDAIPGPKTLAIVPMGDRSLDSEHMLTVARHDRLSLWAWAGTFPRFSRALREALDPVTGDPDKAAVLLSQVWPPAYLLDDRRPFGHRTSFDYAAFFGPRATLLAEDPEFRLFRVAPPPGPVTEAVRLARRDFVAAHPVAVFTLSAPAPARVWLDFNDVLLAAFDVSPEPVTHAISVSPELLLARFPERFRFHAESDMPFTLADFRLQTPDHPLSADILQPVSFAPFTTPDLPWLPLYVSLPPTAIPADFRYPRGISLCGVSPIVRVPATGPDTLPFLRFRLYLRFPADVKTTPDLYLAPGYALPDGGAIYKNPQPMRRCIDPAALPVAAGRIVAADVEMPVLSHLPEGTTYDITLDLMTSSGRRLHPRDPDGRKNRHPHLPLTYTVHH